VESARECANAGCRLAVQAAAGSVRNGVFGVASLPIPSGNRRLWLTFGLSLSKRVNLAYQYILHAPAGHAGNGRRAMNTRAAITLALALLVGGLSSSAGAHHSQAQFDRCHPFVVEGSIERVLWENPHVEIALRGDDGMMYSIVWLNLQQLKRDGVAKDELKVGDRVQISGAKQPEDKLRVISLVTAIQRPSDGWEWSRPPQGCPR
jgi:hypothetical protein